MSASAVGTGPHRAAPRLLGAVLAGGASRRFGRDKTAVRVGGLRMIERAVAALAGPCAEVVVVSARADTPTGPWTVLSDEQPGLGPLGGIEAALREAKRRKLDGVVVLAADLPLVDAALVRSLIDRVGAGASRAAAAGREGTPPFEPLCAVYPTAALPTVSALVEADELAAQKLFERLDGTVVAVDARHLLNVNTREDLARAEAAEPESNANRSGSAV